MEMQIILLEWVRDKQFVG